jgi:enamine deaminase RidA (YjgF/YER057c/UK114 family)
VFEEIFSEIFLELILTVTWQKPKPVRCVVSVGELYYGCLIEMDCVAGV